MNNCHKQTETFDKSMLTCRELLAHACGCVCCIVVSFTYKAHDLLGAYKLASFGNSVLQEPLRTEERVRVVSQELKHHVTQRAFRTIHVFAILKHSPP